MKIVYITDKILFNSVGKIVLTEASEMVKLGHKVYIVCAHTNSYIKNIYPDFIWHDLNYQEYGRTRYWLSLVPNLRVKKIKEILSCIKPDVVHIHNIHQYLSFFVFFIARKYARKVFYTTHDVMSFHYGKLVEFLPSNIEKMRYDPDLMKHKFDYKVDVFQQIKRFRKRIVPFRGTIIKHYINDADKVFAVSGELKKTLNDNGIKNVDILYNPIDVNLYSSIEDELNKFKDKHNLKNKKIILFGGRLSYHKGYRQFLRSFERTLNKNYEVVGVVLGVDQKFKNRIINESSKDLLNNMFLSEYLSSEEYVIAMLSSDIVVIPSICFDSAPLMVMEAMACKKPVVATCFGGAKEIVRHKETGYIVNPFNIDELTERILDIILNDEIAQEFGEKGLETVKNNFSVKKHIDKLLEYYNE